MGFKDAVYSDHHDDEYRFLATMPNLEGASFSVTLHNIIFDNQVNR